MKEIETLVEGPKEEQIERTLHSLGLTRCEAKILIYLLSFKEGTSVEIERAMALHQSEVSPAISLLSSKNYINIRTLRHNLKGRPKQLYTITNIPSVLSDIQTTAQSRIDSTLTQLAQLKDLILE